MHFFLPTVIFDDAIKIIERYSHSAIDIHLFIEEKSVPATVKFISETSCSIDGKDYNMESVPLLFEGKGPRTDQLGVTSTIRLIAS